MNWSKSVAAIAALLSAIAAPATAQGLAVPASSALRVQSAQEALAQDVGAVAAILGVTPGESERQLRLQQASEAATDAIAARFAGRLATIRWRPSG
ncbi:MAG: hypothetical protein EOP67_69910 [Sphingomonas sp.]|nr:MAG: hypothetical protein EOP67_69910 [Sphingomonas sp.]